MKPFCKSIIQTSACANQMKLCIQLLKWTILMSLTLLVNSGATQPMKRDTIIRPTNESAVPSDSMYKNKKQITTADSMKKESWRSFTNYFRLDFFSTLNSFQYINSTSVNIEKSNFYFYYNLNILNQFKMRFFNVNSCFYNELGYRQYLDSIAVKNEDIYYFKFDINSPLTKTLNVILTYQVKSQFWSTWQYNEGVNGRAERKLNSGYFSPGYINFSSGLSHDFWNNCHWEIGLAGGQITKIRNQKIYESTTNEELFGIVKGKKRKVEFVLNLLLQVPAKQIGKNVYWENSSRLFAKGREVVEIKSYSLDFNNGFHFLFLKHLRLGLRTKVNYDLSVSEKMVISNMILFGFYLSNKM